jgi:hypothetical protein
LYAGNINGYLPSYSLEEESEGIRLIITGGSTSTETALIKHGQKGEKGDPGEPIIPYISNGYWYINDVNTYQEARGPQGPQGI